MEKPDLNQENIEDQIGKEIEKLKGNVGAVTPLLDKISNGLKLSSSISLIAVGVISYFKKKAMVEYASIALPQSEIYKELASDKDILDPDSPKHKVFNLASENIASQTEHIINQMNHYAELLQISAGITAATASGYLLIQLYKFLQKHGSRS